MHSLGLHVDGMHMATFIHVNGENAPRLVGFDTGEVARYAAGLMGLDPGSYILVELDAPSGCPPPLSAHGAGVLTAQGFLLPRPRTQRLEPDREPTK